MQVDVEDKAAGTWQSLATIDGGLSGWRLLWDRLCPIPNMCFNIIAPRYRELVNALTWIAHTQKLREIEDVYKFDLYLRPSTVHEYKLMDYHLVDNIVRSSYRCAPFCRRGLPV